MVQNDEHTPCKTVEEVSLILHEFDIFDGFLLRDSLMWRCDTVYAPATFFINTNDLFYWACADMECVHPANIHILKQSFKDLREVDKVIGCQHTTALFACRVNKMRPQGCAYPEEDKYWHLFDEAGPERTDSDGTSARPKQESQKD